MIIISQLKLIIFIFIIFTIFIIRYILIKNDYWYRICYSAVNKDYYKWILSDKYIAKLYAQHLGFHIPKTYQLVDKPENINFNSLPQNYVIKPVDLCDSTGVYLIKNNINLINDKIINKDIIINELNDLRKTIDRNYYMYYYMYNGKIPYKGYIVEELLLDNENIPYDYKCYVFGGKVYFIAITYDRQKINGKTVYKSVWMTPDWKPMYFNMSRKNYYYNHLPKPKNLYTLIKLLENASKNLERHCRIDVYNINGKIYLGEFTFFCGAFLHTLLCNTILGIIWQCNPDNNKKKLKFIHNIVPDYYTKI